MKIAIELIRQYCLNHGYDDKNIDYSTLRSCLLSVPAVQNTFIKKTNWIYFIFERVIILDGKYFKFQYSEDVYGNIVISWDTLTEVVPYTEMIEVTKYKPKE